MIRSGGGRIIYLSSVVGVQAGPGGALYGGSKAAVNILANVAHQELANDGIRTVALAPGRRVTVRGGSGTPPPGVPEQPA